jgi:hypothetical protein
VARVTYVAAVIGDLEDFVGEVFNLTCPAALLGLTSHALDNRHCLLGRQVSNLACLTKGSGSATRLLP